MSRKQSSLMAISFVLALTAANVSAAMFRVADDTTPKPGPDPIPDPTTPIPTPDPKPTPDPTTPKPDPTPKPAISTPVCETCMQLAKAVKGQIAQVHPYLGLLCQLNTAEMDVQNCIKLINASVVHLATKPPMDTCQKLGLCKIKTKHETFVEL